MDSTPSPDKIGILYVVATPIGNMDDITLRAIKTLDSVDFIAAEDTRRTGRLLASHGIRGRLVSYEEHNERRRTKDLVEKLHQGQTVALVSDAGTPSISDPGYRLIKSAIENGIAVLPIPGVSATTAALSVSGMATDAYTFIGFPPRKKEKRLTLLSRLSTEERTLIFYESPKRIASLIDDIIVTMGDRQGVLAREMTKLYEEFLRDTLSQIHGALGARASVKGECTLLVAGHVPDETATLATARNDLKEALSQEGNRLSEVVKKVARTHGLPKKRVYREALKMKGDSTQDA